MGKQPIDDEDRQSHRHEHKTQDQHLLERRTIPDRHELGQEGQEEDRKLGIEDVEHEPSGNRLAPSRSS